MNIAIGSMLGPYETLVANGGGGMRRALADRLKAPAAAFGECALASTRPVGVPAEADVEWSLHDGRKVPGTIAR